MARYGKEDQGYNISTDKAPMRAEDTCNPALGGSPILFPVLALFAIIQ